MFFLPSKIEAYYGKQYFHIHFIISILCLLGFSTSFYVLFVEANIEKNPNYSALCDINEHVSCTKAFSSKYGRGFGVVGDVLGETSPLNQYNSSYGMAFYTIILILNFANTKFTTNALMGISFISNFFSIYLLYILVFILYDFCVVCFFTYIINLTLTYFSYLKLISYRLKERSKAEEDKEINKKDT